MNVEEHDLKKMDVEGATAIVSFPTVGMIGTIAMNYLVRNMDFDLIGEFTSEEFYPIVMIHEGEPVQPVRIHGGFIKDPDGNDKQKVVVIMSEVPLKREHFYSFSREIIDWCKKKNIKEIITLEGINTDRDFDGDENIEVFSVGSLPQLQSRIENLPVKSMDNGMISGMSGSLLYYGKNSEIPVFCFLTEAYSQFPDSRSAAATVRILNAMLTEVDLDPEPLIEEAEKIEEEVKKALKQVTPKSSTQIPTENQRMYG